MKRLNNVMNKAHTKWCSYLMVLTLLIAGTIACEDDLANSTYKTAEVPMIDEYMEQNNLTSFLALVEKADYRGMLHAYGSYTCFVPTDEAVKEYLNKEGLSLETISKEAAEAIVGFHIINDSIPTSEFVDGRMPSQNIKKHYLTTATKSDASGEVYIEINRESRILTKDVVLGNGYINVIDKALKLATKTVAETIAELPDAQFSMMKEWILETGFEDVLAKVNSSTSTEVKDDEKYVTYFLHTNEALAELGIETKEDLLVRLRSNTPDVTEDDELLLNYIKYHCVPGRKYITDLMYASALSTYGSNEVLTFKMTKELDILINEFKVDEIDEDGMPLIKESEYSDLTCANGVIHLVEGSLEIKKRKPYRVYWEMDQPEMRALKGFRKTGTSVSFQKGELSEMTWDGQNKPSVTYICSMPSKNDDNNLFTYGDRVDIRVCTKVVQWIEMKLPLLIEGNYKVWVTYGRQSKGTSVRAIFKQENEEDQILSNIFKSTSYSTRHFLDAAKTKLDYDKMEQEGWKQYTPRNITNKSAGFLWGVIKVTSTGRHTLRLEPTAAGGAAARYDQIQFIPIDEDQIWPMVDVAGSLIYANTPPCEIWPYDLACE
ncbi:fasciclin domain-containing protein [Bacteroides sp. 214]|uniref:fasciclin domain-containing protein n=1 Tax=Bacteroides sp. 214 TaxID=2302935 RepID=UPI0013D71E2B|nr:fasciclin domain-containing protein [Bacteroides sp. 214]NDW11440.1 fasciclin domain-containing protein [Bacteroides sp. 214]